MKSITFFCYSLSHVKWVGSDIVVDDVRITPPYKTENIIGTNDYVRKVVSIRS